MNSMDQHDTEQESKQNQKLTYVPPVLSLLELQNINGGIGHLQETDGAGFVSS